MCYSVVDVESEICELRSLRRGRGLNFEDIACWRIGQMLNEVSAGSTLRNARILSAIDQIEEAIDSISNSKNKRILKNIIQCKKKEIKTCEGRRKKLALAQI